MSVLEVIGARYSCRSYLDKPVEQEKLDRILDAARLAPSARNCQQWRFVIVRDAEMRARLMVAASGQKFVGQAPVVIVGVAMLPDYVMKCGQHASPIDVAIAMEHIALQAVEEGLATCWIGSFDSDEIKKLLNIPPELAVIQLMPLGYPAADQKPKAKDRLPIEQIACDETWTFA